jgi:hypothetical protein
MALHLTDMEELLSRVASQVSKDYMAEALRCYHAGAFRGCVVLSYIALFNDLRVKLAPLAAVNGSAKQLHQEIEQKAGNQEIFETFLADQLAVTKLIDAAQKAKLKLIIDLRNRSAHPSGMHASAEEARFVFFETIENFLRFPALQTTHAADAILAALPLGNYFPSINAMDVKAVVQSDIMALSEHARPYLVAKLIEACESVNEVLRATARAYIFGLAALQSDDWRKLLQKQIVVGKATVDAFSFLVVGVLNLDPALDNGLQDIDRKRITALIVKATEAETSQTYARISHPMGWLKSFVVEHGQKYTLTNYQAAVEKLIEKYRYDEALMGCLDMTGPIQDAYIAEYLEHAKSSTFDVSKLAAGALPKLDEVVGASLTDEAAFRLVAATQRAADHGTWAAQSLVSGKYTGVPQLRAKALVYAQQHSAEAQAYLSAIFVTDTLSDLASVLQAPKPPNPFDDLL